MIDAESHGAARCSSRPSAGRPGPSPTGRSQGGGDVRRLPAVTGDGRSLEAERIVVAAGGWLPALLARLPLPAAFRALVPRCEVSQENAYHFPYRDCAAGTWPTFIHKDSAIQIYSLPGGRDAEFRGQKLAEYNGGRKIGLGGRPGREHRPDEPGPDHRLRPAVRAGPGARAVRRDDLPVHQHSDAGLPHRRSRRHHPRFPLLRARRQVRAADRRAWPRTWPPVPAVPPIGSRFGRRGGEPRLIPGAGIVHATDEAVIDP